MSAPAIATEWQFATEWRKCYGWIWSDTIRIRIFRIQVMSAICYSCAIEYSERIHWKSLQEDLADGQWLYFQKKDWTMKRKIKLEFALPNFFEWPVLLRMHCACDNVRYHSGLFYRAQYMVFAFSRWQRTRYEHMVLSEPFRIRVSPDVLQHMYVLHWLLEIRLNCGKMNRKPTLHGRRSYGAVAVQISVILNCCRMPIVLMLCGYALKWCRPQRIRIGWWDVITVTINYSRKIQME